MPVNCESDRWAARRRCRSGRYESNARYAAGHLLFLSGGQLVARRFDASTGTVSGPTLPVVTTPKFATWNKLAAFSVSESGVLAYHPGGPIVSDQRLTWRDRNGRTRGTVGPVGRFPTLDLSPDGQHLAVSILAKSGNQTDIWIIDFTRGDAVPLTSDPAWEFDPGWSRDGNRIAFNSNRNGGRFNLFSRPSNGGGRDELLVAAQAAAETPVWSPDDRSIVYGDDGDVWIRPLDVSQTAVCSLENTCARESCRFVSRRSLDRLHVRQVRSAGDLCSGLSIRRHGAEGVARWRRSAEMARRQRRDLLLVARRDNDGGAGRDIEGHQDDDPRAASLQPASVSQTCAPTPSPTTDSSFSFPCLSIRAAALQSLSLRTGKQYWGDDFSTAHSASCQP